MIEQVTGNWVCWAILGLALVCYQQLWLEYLARSDRATGDEAQMEDSLKREFSGVLIGTLPLLGLLGTIIGLLECFAGMSAQGTSNELVSGGIADALVTTQLGLVCAIPGWLLQSFVRSEPGRSTPSAANSIRS